MLDFIKTALQAELNAYNAIHHTTLTHVSVFDINSLEREARDIYDQNVITVIYRELPGTLPSIPSADRTVNVTLQILAVEVEKTAVTLVFDAFINKYNTTRQDDVIVRFTNITPVGRPDNIGAYIYQQWQMNVTILIIEKLSTIFDREMLFADALSDFNNTWGASDATYYDAQLAGNRALVIGATPSPTLYPVGFALAVSTGMVWVESTDAYWDAQSVGNRGFEVRETEFLPSVDANDYAVGYAWRVEVTMFGGEFVYYVAQAVTPYTYSVALAGDYNRITVDNGLVRYMLSKTPVYGEYPTSTTSVGKVHRWNTLRLTVEVLDIKNDIDVLALKALIYDENYAKIIIAVSDAKSVTFAGKIVDASDNSSFEGFPTLVMTWERG